MFKMLLRKGLSRTAEPGDTVDPLTTFTGIRRIDPEHEMDVEAVASLCRPHIPDRPRSASSTSVPVQGKTLKSLQAMDAALEADAEIVASTRQALHRIRADDRPEACALSPDHHAIMADLREFTLQMDAMTLLFGDGITHVLSYGSHELDESLVVLRYQTDRGGKECYICPECLSALAWKYEALPDGSFVPVFACSACGLGLRSPVSLSEDRTLNYQGVFNPQGAPLAASLTELNVSLANTNDVGFLDQQQGLSQG